MRHFNACFVNTAVRVSIFSIKVNGIAMQSQHFGATCRTTEEGARIQESAQKKERAHN